MSGPGERLYEYSFLVPRALLLVGWLCSLPTPGRAQTPVSEWMLAGPYPAERVNREAYPSFYSIFLAPWREIEADPGGTVDLDLQVSRENAQGDLVIARHVFRSDTERVVDLEMGVAGEVDVFFNRLRVFSGRRAGAMPQGRPMVEPRLPDRVPLYVKKGLNEIFLMVSSRGEPWAFRAGTTEPLAPKIRAHELAAELWATPDTFLTSESVLKDPSRPLLYVSSFDNQYATRTEAWMSAGSIRRSCSQW